MTKVDRVIREISQLRDFYIRTQGLRDQLRQAEEETRKQGAVTNLKKRTDRERLDAK